MGTKTPSKRAASAYRKSNKKSLVFSKPCLVSTNKKKKSNIVTTNSIDDNNDNNNDDINKDTNNNEKNNIDNNTTSLYEENNESDDYDESDDNNDFNSINNLNSNTYSCKDNICSNIFNINKSYSIHNNTYNNNNNGKNDIYNNNNNDENNINNNNNNNKNDIYNNNKNDKNNIYNSNNNSEKHKNNIFNNNNFDIHKEKEISEHFKIPKKIIKNDDNSNLNDLKSIITKIKNRIFINNNNIHKNNIDNYFYNIDCIINDKNTNSNFENEIVFYDYPGNDANFTKQNQNKEIENGIKKNNKTHDNYKESFEYYIKLSIKICYKYINFKENFDIDFINDKNNKKKNYDRNNNKNNYDRNNNKNDISYDAIFDDIEKNKKNCIQLFNFYENYKKNYFKIILNNNYNGIIKFLLLKLCKLRPQFLMDGKENLWIIKPGEKSRGRGISCCNNFEKIMNVYFSVGSSTMVQKYIETPLLVENTKFDIRQWFLVTCWSPLTLYFYEKCYIRFCSHVFSLTDLSPSIHLCNNSIQKNYLPDKNRSPLLPVENMWTCDEFKDFLRKQGFGKSWEEMVVPGMKEIILSTLLCCQEEMKGKKNSFELFGADFMLTDSLQLYLLEINRSPSLSTTTKVTKDLCFKVIDDLVKVLIDLPENPSCDTGYFRLQFKQPFKPKVKSKHDVYISSLLWNQSSLSIIGNKIEKVKII